MNKDTYATSCHNCGVSIRLEVLKDAPIEAVREAMDKLTHTAKRHCQVFDRLSREFINK